VIIDSHLHVWSDDESRYPFGEVSRPASGDGASVELLNEHMAKAGVDKAVIVQPIHYLYDNRYVAECLARFPGRFAAVALVDPTDAEAPDNLEELVLEKGFGGMRLHLSRQADPAALAALDQDRLWRRVEELNVCLIVLGKAAELPALEPIVGRFPGVNVVLDHLGGPPVGEEPPHPLLGNVLRMAKYPNVYVKVSNMNRLSRLPYPHRDTHDMVRRIYDAFGPERLMWGTDFPHVLAAGGYLPALELTRDELGFLNDDDKEWLFSRTVRKVWKFLEPFH
jgi:predicted TIM-barrel fold metal-dependent hydrolase